MDCIVDIARRVGMELKQAIYHICCFPVMIPILCLMFSIPSFLLINYKQAKARSVSLDVLLWF